MALRGRHRSSRPDRFAGEFPGYVSAAERQARARLWLHELEREGLAPAPVRIEGRELAHTFWGRAWCDHLDRLADLASRLPRGRAYVRSGAVLHLAIARGAVHARVAGTDLYTVDVGVAPLPAARWGAVRRACAGRIATAVELLSGKLAAAVMAVLCDPEQGLFPRTPELDLRCSCPDGAWLCKHLAAVLYGVGARLDARPELLFTLRGVALEDLVADASAIGSRGPSAPAAPFSDAELAEIFGIELTSGPPLPLPAPTRRRRAGPRPRRAPARPAARGRRARPRNG